MDSEAEPPEQSSASNIRILPLLRFSSSPSPPPSPGPSGTLTSPLYSSTAAVPFQWEQEPGKPKHSTAIVAISNPAAIDSSLKSLELPPRLIISQNPHGLGCSNRFRSPSLRMGSDCYGSFRADRGRVPVRAVVRSRRRVGFGLREKGQWFGSWRKKKREASGGSYVFPSCGVDNREISHVDAFGGTQKNRVEKKRFGVWTRIREGLEQMGVWRSKKLKKMNMFSGSHENLNLS